MLKHNSYHRVQNPTNMPTTMRLDYIILQIHEEKNPKDVSVVFHVHKEFITESFWFSLQQFSRSPAPLIWVA